MKRGSHLCHRPLPPMSGTASTFPKDPQEQAEQHVASNGNGASVIEPAPHRHASMLDEVGRAVPLRSVHAHLSSMVLQN